MSASEGARLRRRASSTTSMASRLACHQGPSAPSSRSEEAEKTRRFEKSPERFEKSPESGSAVAGWLTCESWFYKPRAFYPVCVARNHLTSPSHLSFLIFLEPACAISRRLGCSTNGPQAAVTAAAAAALSAACRLGKGRRSPQRVQQCRHPARPLRPLLLQRPCLAHCPGAAIAAASGGQP